jgi:DASH complex subunit ASK1
MSSPPAAAPQLHAEIFSSPIRQQYNKLPAPRTPGVSVQPIKSKAKDIVPKPPKKDEISWESDSDEDAEGVYRELGMSPPKTIQFSLPQSRLLQTPGQYSELRYLVSLLIILQQERLARGLLRTCSQPREQDSTIRMASMTVQVWSQ